MEFKYTPTFGISPPLKSEDDKYGNHIKHYKCSVYFQLPTETCAGTVYVPVYEYYNVKITNLVEITLENPKNYLKEYLKCINYHNCNDIDNPTFTANTLAQHFELEDYTEKHLKGIK